LTCMLGIAAQKTATMNTSSHHPLVLAATAAALISTVPSTTGLINTKQLKTSRHSSFSKVDYHCSRQQHWRRPSSVTALSAQSELEKLRSKREAILKRHFPEATDDSEARSTIPLETDCNESFNGLEYLYDIDDERHDEDLFHIILMPSTFKNPYMSIEYASESCSEILRIPREKSYDLSLYVKHQGFARLGTWTHEECVTFGRQLREMELDCRIIPYHSSGGDNLEDSLFSLESTKAIAVTGMPNTATPEEKDDNYAKKAFVEDTYLYSFTGQK